MSSNDSKPKRDLKDMSKEDRLPLFLVIFTVFVLASQWAYSYFMADPLKFPWGKLVYNVSDDDIELLDYELLNYLGARAAQDEANEYVYNATDLNLVAAAGFSIRTGPGVYYQSIGRMYYGREVHVIATSQDNDWYMIDFYGEEAYVHRACLFEKLPEAYEFVPASNVVVRVDENEETTEETTDIEETEAIDATEETEATANSESIVTPTPVATPVPTNTLAPSPTEAPSSVVAPTDPTMLELFNLVNNARVNAGLQPLSWNSGLASAASVRAQEISISFSHTRPDGSQWWSVNSNLMYGENLAGGQSTAQEVFNSWWNSPGHKANIMNPDFRTCGYALYYCGDAGMTYYWTQEFGY